MPAPHSSLSHFHSHAVTHSLSHDVNAPTGEQRWKALLTFFQASYRPHSSATVSDNKQLWGTREKGRDGHAHTRRQQWIPYRHTHTHTHTHTYSFPQPPSSYGAPHNYSHSKTTPHCPWSAVRPPAGNNKRDGVKQKMRRLWGSVHSWRCLSETSDDQRQAAVWRWNWKWGKVSVKRGIYHQTQSHFLLGGLSTL